MEVDSGGSVVPSRRRVRRAKRPADSNKNFEDDELQPPAARRNPPVIVDGPYAQDAMQGLCIPPVRLPRSAGRRQSISCARCRIYDWKEHRFAKPSVVKQRRQPKVRQGQKSAAPTSDSDIFSWNLSLEERRKRDSRSALPTAKNVAVPTPTRRILRPDPLMENDLVGCAHEGSTPMTIGPSTSEVNCCLTQTPDALKTATKAAGVRRRRNGAATAGASVERAFQAEMVADEVVRGTAGRTSRKRIMGQAAPMPLARSAREVRVRSLGRSDKGQRGAASGHTVNEAAAIVKGVRSSDSSADAAGTMADEEAEKRCAQDAEKEKEKEKQKKTELAKRAMEELMKHQNFAPVEVIVADAISKDPLGFVHSLRDAKLLRSLEKLAQLRQLNVSSEEAKSLRKQRKKEKKREKREKKKQKRLMRLAANCGVSIEQLELEMSMDRSDSRASAPGSSPLSLNGSLLGSANTPPTLLTSSGLSNLPGPSPGSYLNVFPRPSFVPDPLNPLRNLAAERTDSSRQGTPNGDSYSPLILPPAPITTPNSTHSNERDRYASSDYAPSFMSTEEQRAALANGNLQNLQQCGDYLVKAGRAADDGSNGNTPEDEEDEQNAIAISHLFPQFDALQQLKLIQMCTDSKVEEVDEQDVVSMVLNPEAGSSNKVARTLALIKGKVKEFKEINGMRRASDGGCSIQEGEPRLLRIDEDEDVDVEDVGGNDAALLEQVRRNAMRSSWRVPEPILSASEPVETRTVAGMRVALQPGAKESSGGQCIQSFVSSAPEPCTSTQADVDPLSNCITGMADMGFGLQPRMLSILDEPLNSTPLDDHPPHRTPAVTLTEVPVHEDDENIYTSEMKVVTDWFNHAPYGAGRDAHIRYWDDVRQRVIVADWIRKLQQKRFDQVLLNLSRRRIHRRRAEMRTKGKCRSKSTEPWWPRKLFEHYEGALDLAGKVMRTADSSSGACDSEVPSINNVAMKVIRLDDDETATLAYFRPGSPLTVSDPTDDYQEHVLAQDLDEATLITKDVFTQMDLDHDDEKVRYLPWLKVRRISAYSSISAPGSTRTSSRTSNKSTHASALTPVPTQSEPSADIDSRSTLVSTSNSMPVTNVALVKQPNSQQFLPAASNTYGFLAPNGCYPSHSVYAGVIGTSSDKLSVPVSQVPLLAPDASRTIPIGLPPLSTVFDGLQQPSASCVPYVHLPTQTQPGLSNPYGEIVYTHSQVTAAAAQSFAGFPASAPSLATNIYAGNEQTAALPSTSGGKVHRNSDANGLLPSDFLRDSHSSNHLSNAYHASGGLTKDSIVDQDMEDFFRTVLEECETRPTTHSESQPFFDEEMDPFLAMDQLT